MSTPVQFTLRTIGTYAITLAVLFVFNLVPDELKWQITSPQTTTASVTLASKDGSSGADSQWITQVDPTAEPKRIVIEKIGVDAQIFNPKTTDPTVLDQNLLQGAVHYPGSGMLKDQSNVFIFGHSTRHTVVHNEAYKTFNRLNELNIGDTIIVRSETDEYIYTVSLVSKTTASDALVTFSHTKKMLTLSTCDSFGQKTDRFVVEAEFTKSNPIPRS